MNYGGLGFLAATPTLPPLPSGRFLSFSVFLRVLPVELTDGRGGGGEGMGEEPNHRPRGNLVLYNSLNTLWWEGWWGDGEEKTAMRKRYFKNKRS
jgi:hypothetical protein